MSGGSGPQGMQITRPITMKKKPPQSITRLSSNLRKTIAHVIYIISMYIGATAPGKSLVYLSVGCYIVCVCVRVQSPLTERPDQHERGAGYDRPNAH